MIRVSFFWPLKAISGLNGKNESCTAGSSLQDEIGLIVANSKNVQKKYAGTNQRDSLL